MVPNIRPLNDLSSRADELLTEVEQTRSPLVITREGHPAAVLQDVCSYNEMQESLTMLKILLLGRQEAENGDLHDVSDVVREIRASRNKR